MNYAKEFRIKPGTTVDLNKIDASNHGTYQSEDSAIEDLEKYCQRLTELQALMHAENKHSLLIVLQAMDAGGSIVWTRD